MLDMRVTARTVAGITALVLVGLGSVACDSGKDPSYVDFKDPFWSSPPLVDYMAQDYQDKVDLDSRKSGGYTWEQAVSRCFASVVERNLAAVRVQSAIDRDDQARKLKQLPSQTVAEVPIPTPSLHAAIDSDSGVTGHDLNLCFTVVYTNKSLPSPR
ncbi:Uncharacterised protein [Mycobacteroides abscessus subsp. massiliense]|uniref:Uncharacterized protein n=1 Tax=Mycobacteroides immunogenum TaxID=83262 RepID=A0A7V8LPE3_9MYCO|nr:hypothetical protein BAB75_01425 [Mycobacteroides immunogenum]SKU12287.1 Uncharacterised protein [Mycobacteroides abscessus subsp. massiliense]KIU40593.1 hypothetical protein TL11_10045 [Mycobacteroides immunogenum]KPG11260.1 hypothetical protein AN908_12845 [Mycobacteroides immunogenum]KPG13987.1 hypothetical protein AN910_09190 [Mycobacteroides immunogenum]